MGAGAVDFNTLTSTLTALIGAYSGAYDRVQPIAHKVLGSLALIEIALAGLYLALDGGHQVSALFGKFLKIAVWTYITTNFHTLVQAFSQSLIGAGLIAAGHPGNFQILLDPSKIAAMGTTATEALAQALSNVSALDFADAIIFGLMYLAIMLTFLLMAVQIFLAVAEFYLISALAGVLIGFGVSKHFEFLAQKAVGAVVACSVKLMVLAFVMSMVGPTLASLKFVGPEIKFNELWALLLTSGTIMLFAWTAPSLAASLLAGSPSLGAAGVAQNMMSGAMMVSGLGGLATTVARGAGAVLGAGARGAGVVAGGATAGIAGAGTTGYAASALGAAGGATRAAAAGAAGLAKAPFAGLRDQFGKGFQRGASAGVPKPAIGGATGPLGPATGGGSAPSSGASARRPAAWAEQARTSLLGGTSGPPATPPPASSNADLG
jgi:type IV secretion system protein TrbL